MSAAAVFLTGVVPFAIGAAAVAKRLAYASAVPAEARVLEVERLWLRDFVYPVPRRAIYRLAYEFRTAQGVAVRGEGTYVQSRTLAPASVGDSVRIQYLPGDPASTYLEDWHTVFDAALAIGAGLLVWGGGGWYLWKRRRKPATAPAPGS